MHRIIPILGLIVAGVFIWRKQWLPAFWTMPIAFMLTAAVRRNWRRALAWLLLCLLAYAVLLGALLVRSSMTDTIGLVRGGLAVFALIISVAAIVFILCSELYIVTRSADRRGAWKGLLGFVLGFFPIPRWFPLHAVQFLRCIQIIRDGKMAWSYPPSDTFKMIGPGFVIIDVGHAVVFENTGRITRIYGSGFVQTVRFEMISAIVDLRLQQEEITVEDAFTRDYIPLTIHPTLFYRVRVNEERLRLSGQQQYEFEEGDIRRAVLGVSDWREATLAAAKSITRDIVASYYLDDIYDPMETRSQRGLSSPRQLLQQQLWDRLNEVTENWGVRVNEIRIGDIKAPEQVCNRMMDTWEAVREKEAMISRGEGETEVYRMTELARAKAQMEMITAITQGFKRMQDAGVGVPADLIALRFIEALERMAADPATKMLLPFDVSETLRALRSAIVT